MKQVLYIFIFLSAVSCKTVSVSEQRSSNTKDSVDVKEVTVIRDSLIYTDVDSAAIKALVICPDGKPLDVKPIIVKGHKKATAIFEIKNGVASVKCLCDSDAIISRYINTTKTAFKSSIKEEKEKTVEVKEVVVYPLWLKILASIGVSSVLFFTYRLSKKFK